MILLIFTGGNGKYSEPLYYLFYQDETVTIYHSRAIHYDLNGTVSKETEKVNKMYNDKTIEEIELEAVIIARSISSKKIWNTTKQP